MRNYLTRTTILAAVTVATLTTGTAVHAATPAGQWNVATCATGTVTGSGTAEGDIRLQGEATRCDGGGIGSASQAALVFFHPGRDRAAVLRVNMWRYGPTGTGSATIVKRRDPGTFGVCVMRTYTWRMACAEVTVTADQSVTVRQIPTNDPLVAANVDTRVVEPYEYDGDDPYCGTCV